MASADPLMPPTRPSGADVLDVLAEAVLHRLDQVLGARVESLSAQARVLPEPGWLRVSEVAKRVGASERTVYRALRSGALAGERLGAHWRIRPDAIDAWLADPRPPRTGIGPPARAAKPPARPDPSPPRTFMTRARQGQGPQDAPGRPTTNRGEAANKEQL